MLLFVLCVYGIIFRLPITYMYSSDVTYIIYVLRHTQCSALHVPEVVPLECYVALVFSAGHPVRVHSIALQAFS